MIVEYENLLQIPTIAQWSSGIMLKINESGFEDEFLVTYEHSNINCSTLALERIGKSFGDFAIIPVPNHLFTMDGTIYISCSGGFYNITVSSANKPVNYENNCLPDVDANRAGIEAVQKRILTFLDIYPVGSIYVSVNSVNPGTVFGGEWEQIKDTFLLAAGDKYSSGETGGAESQEISTAHKHVAPIGTNGTYFGLVDINGTVSGGSGRPFQTAPFTASGSSPGNVTLGYTSDATVNAAVPTMPPYLAVYVWERTA